ncbi:FoF1 ATP synthase subunit B' [Campylobacter sp. MIT 21-1685]|uniref:FoF1 ATP synthase subunit B' n=1 Tax=unclassified Campylobacter TaxID=2593542 RepID=UPI00224ABEA2|nr:MULTISPECIES: FoF1 ATP synthase subunit B' [unclassified Campylobacter]MCX2683338.1 FoF1 ATP synthase subunit B' [Campylobacter sp. MIT 21-1684]MCX2751607.1 FoF1 ATP synthase subunit B' [Campylobacter sp. MIT 21-1682]MCX2807806.1 FoF1 ATP synthase subunit B' [Campylobacter sp. MIT 21-1685]
MFEDMHFSIMFATMAIFLAMIAILNSMLYKPLLQFMDERDDSIRNDENKVKENSQEMFDVNEELEKIHTDTRDEIHRIKQNAVNAAKEESEKILRNKKDELDRAMGSFYTELVAQKQELQEYLADHLSELRQLLENNMKRI